MSKHFVPNDFNKAESAQPLMGMCGRIEYEEQIAWRLNEHIKLKQPFHIPIDDGKYQHDSMVDKGWLRSHGDRKYTLTPLSIAILWNAYGKH